MHPRPPTLPFLLACLLAGPCLGSGLPACDDSPAARAGLAAAKAAMSAPAAPDGPAAPSVPDAVPPARVFALAACLGHPDPALRDGLAYELLAHWLRADAIDATTRTRLRDALLAMLAGPDDDPAGFRRPFAVLVLSEVARTDRIAPWLSPAERQALLDAGTGYLRGLRDYRGYVDGEGWRHGLAHGADLLMQLALNPALEPAQLAQVLDAVATQVAPPGAPAYVHGESERLLRPVLFALQRGGADEAAWTAWLARITDPAPMAAWSQAYGSEATLARRHNLRLFLLALHAALSDGGDDALRGRLPPVAQALRSID